MRNPTILWTYDLEPDLQVLDDFFQQHLLMNVYPMAPMPKNDHSIIPGEPVVEKAYRDYAQLFDLMHGARWLLSSDPVSISFAPSLATVERPPLRETATAPIRNPVSMQVCKAGAKEQQWIITSDGTDEIKLGGASSTTCLGLWCCGCKTCCGPACLNPDEGAQAAANTCHPADKNPSDFNQGWVVAANGEVTEKKSGKQLVATGLKAGATVVVVSAASMPPSQRHPIVKTRSGTLAVAGSSPTLCLSKNGPAPSPPPPPMTPEVNVFTLPSRATDGELDEAVAPPALLIPIVLASAHTTTTLMLSLAPAVLELGWAAVTSVTAEALHPGEASVPVKLPAAKKLQAAGKWAVEVPLVRGMAMVTVNLH